MSTDAKRQLLLIAGVLFMAALAYAIRTSVSGDEPAAVSSASLEVTNEEVVVALASLESDATFAALTAGAAWSIAERLPNIDSRTASKAGVALIVVLAMPVASSGPWKSLHCQGTVVQEFEFPYTGVSALLAVFAPTGELLSLRPMPSETLSYPLDAETIDSPGCPLGLEDEEN